MEIKKFKESLIAFDFENEMINATDMLKKYPNKNMGNFLRNQQTKDFIKVFESDMQNYTSNDFQAVTIVKGNFTGKTQGTWMHKILAYKFAAWLSAEFELFVYKTFDEIIQKKLKQQQYQLDYFWDKSDQKDLYYQNDKK